MISFFQKLIYKEIGIPGGFVLLVNKLTDQAVASRKLGEKIWRQAEPESILWNCQKMYEEHKRFIAIARKHGASEDLLRDPID